MCRACVHHGLRPTGNTANSLPGQPQHVRQESWNTWPMSTEDTAACQILQVTEPAHRTHAGDALIHEQIIITAFNGIYVLVGDADDPTVPQKIATAKQRPQAKGVALVCPPEFLAEHVALHAPV